MSVEGAAGIGAGGSLLGSVVGSISAKKQQERNIKFQRETNAKNEALMREGWARDDTAVQRRTADLVAAGLNPVLAAGGGASSGSAIPLKAPQVEAPRMTENPGLANLSLVSAMADIASKKASIAQTKAQTGLTERAQEGLDLDNKLKAGTLDPKIQEAAAAARVAVESATSRISLSASEAERALQESEAALEYYQQRAHKEGAEYTIAYQKASEMIDDWNLMRVHYGGEVLDSRRYKELDAQLQKTQAEAILAMAVAGQKDMDAEFWKRLGLAPGGGQAILDAFNSLVGALRLLK